MMGAALQRLIIILFLTFAFHTLLSFARHLRAARKTGLSIAISPIDPLNPIWVLFQRFLLPIVRILPFGIGAWTRYNRRGWLFYDKFRMHADLGDAWLHVTPGTLTLYLGNASACQEVYARKDDFTRPTHILRGSFMVLQRWVVLPDIGFRYARDVRDKSEQCKRLSLC